MIGFRQRLVPAEVDHIHRILILASWPYFTPLKTK